MKLEDAPDPVELLHDGFGSVAVCPPWNDTVKEVASLARRPVLAANVETSTRATSEEYLALLGRNEVERGEDGEEVGDVEGRESDGSEARLATRRVFAADVFKKSREVRADTELRRRGPTLLVGCCAMEEDVFEIEEEDGRICYSLDCNRSLIGCFEIRP
jgi:hypothetical protein